MIATGALAERLLSRPLPLLVGLALVFELAVVFWAFGRFDVLAVTAIVVLLAISPAFVFRNDRLLALLAFLVAALQVPRLQFQHAPMAYGLSLALILIGLLHLNFVRERLDRGDLTWPEGGLKAGWILLGVWISVCALVGVLRKNPSNHLAAELVAALHYTIFLPAVDALRTDRRIRVFLLALGAGVLVAALAYVDAAINASFDVNRWGRIVSRQANLVVTAGPFLVAALLIGVRRRGLLVAGFLPCAILILLSQQRALFLGFPLVVAVTALAGFRARAARRGRFLLVLGGVLLATAAGWAATSAIRVAPLGGTVTESVAERGSVAGVTRASSLLIRFASYAHVWERRISLRPITGWGLGDVTDIPVLREGYGAVAHVDNAYLVLLWKSGAVGLVLFLSLFGMGLVRAWRLIGHPRREVQLLALGIFGSFVGILFLSLGSSLVTSYRFNALWAAYMAILVVAERVYPAIPNRRPV